MDEKRLEFSSNSSRSSSIIEKEKEILFLDGEEFEVQDSLSFPSDSESEFRDENEAKSDTLERSPAPDAPKLSGHDSTNIQLQVTLGEPVDSTPLGSDFQLNSKSNSGRKSLELELEDISDEEDDLNQMELEDISDEEDNPNSRETDEAKDIEFPKSHNPEQKIFPLKKCHYTQIPEIVKGKVLSKKLRRAFWLLVKHLDSLPEGEWLVSTHRYMNTWSKKYYQQVNLRRLTEIIDEMPDVVCGLDRNGQIFIRSNKFSDQEWCVDGEWIKESKSSNSNPCPVITKKPSTSRNIPQLSSGLKRRTTGNINIKRSKFWHRNANDRRKNIPVSVSGQVSFPSASKSLKIGGRTAYKTSCQRYFVTKVKGYLHNYPLGETLSNCFEHWKTNGTTMTREWFLGLVTELIPDILVRDSGQRIWLKLGTYNRTEWREEFHKEQELTVRERDAAAGNQGQEARANSTASPYVEESACSGHFPQSLLESFGIIEMVKEFLQNYPKGNTLRSSYDHILTVYPEQKFGSLLKLLENANNMQIMDTGKQIWIRLSIFDGEMWCEECQNELFGQDNAWSRADIELSIKEYLGRYPHGALVELAYKYVKTKMGHGGSLTREDFDDIIKGMLGDVECNDNDSSFPWIKTKAVHKNEGDTLEMATVIRLKQIRQRDLHERID